METPRNRPLKVGMFLQAFENMKTRVTPSWTDIFSIAQHAESVGFDSIWLPDHLYVKFPPDDVYGVWEGWSMLSAVAATTTRVELGSFVACTSFRNPALLAKMAVTVDEISGGRFTLGIGAGWHEPEFRAFGYPFDHRVSRFEEALVVISALLRKGEIDFEGTYYQVRECELRPRGPRPHGPPIMVGASRDRMVHLAAQHADILSRDFGPVSHADLESWQARVSSACAAVDRDPATLERTAAVAIDLPNTQSQMSRPAITGTPGELAESLRGIAALGISHVQIWLEPATMAGIEEFAATLELLDKSS